MKVPALNLSSVARDSPSRSPSRALQPAEFDSNSSGALIFKQPKKVGCLSASEPAIFLAVLLSFVDRGRVLEVAARTACQAFNCTRRGPMMYHLNKARMLPVLSLSSVLNVKDALWAVLQSENVLFVCRRARRVPSTH